MAGEDEELLISADGIRDAEVLVRWPEVTSLQVLSPSGRSLISRVLAIAFESALGNVWTAGLPRLGVRFVINQPTSTIERVLHVKRSERADLEALVAWLNDHLGRSEELAVLNSARPFWREA